ncbi:MAG: helix-turn-helix domain-containing protein [Candidatus Freyarchaeota archaeon]|nr:helix-turn-helix domain-containing protein [Candidatus Freyarchaeota archaeon]MDO8091579.1 helix-turn-helix domain-containing protein [Candidatus Sigynarchaeota archaeon]
MTEDSALLMEIKEMLVRQEKASAELRKRIDQIEKRLGKIEERISNGERFKLTPALLRTLKILVSMDRAAGAEELAEELKLSRNLVSSYLNKLESYGYVQRVPNINESETTARYLFTANYKNLPPRLKQLFQNSA